MNNYKSIDDIADLDLAVNEALTFKQTQTSLTHLAKDKVLCMLFFNSSLRTRLSTQAAAFKLGMQVMVLNVDSDSWKLEFEDGTVMNMDKAEHIKEAVQVVSQYADIIGVRAFPELISRQSDEAEPVIKAFVKYATVPVFSLESATEHPLQALTDVMTIKEFVPKKKPKVVLSWAPHPRKLPHAVANSFVKAMKRVDCEFVITHPEGYHLNPEVTKGVTINTDQKQAMQGADVVYTKNWSCYEPYGGIVTPKADWMITSEKIGTAKFMHCLPLRRNVVVADEVLDSSNSLVIEQANNRTYAALWVINKLLNGKD
jgi:N-succinyl-L-ornithine transcarbamylase